MRSTFCCLFLSAAAIAGCAITGCQGQNTAKRTSPSEHDSNTATETNAATPTSGGESDRLENPLRRADATDQALPSSAAPDIDSARGEERSPDRTDRG